MSGTSAHSPAELRRTAGGSLIDWVDRNLAFVFNVPTVVFLVALVAVPVCLVVLTSFTDWQLVMKPEYDFVGIENYLSMWGDGRWLNAIWHTFYYAFATVVGQLVIGLATALLFNRSFAGKAFYRSVWMMPMIAMSTAVSLVWILFFDASYGVLNHFLQMVGIEPIEWTTSPEWAMPSLILVGIWHHTPFMTLILLAGLQSLPQDPFEAARIDGASRWQVLVHVTLPLMRGHIMVALILRSIFAVKEFDTILAITQGGPLYATETMNMNIYFNAFDYGYMGAASAKGVVFFGMILAIQLVLVGLRRRQWSY
ncbi:MAG: sugar ABC transporter permease [Ectothiorhodospiraceae bacterium]|nr:sugar ABC transporter permease [Chromatiales bacterium]MCP5156396.1 sugar ABC transporter permease [Ectothiorhodospiraceae bacterium]